MLQRIQTLYLLLAIGLMVAFLFIPFGYTLLDEPATEQFKEQSLRAIDFIGLLIPAVLAIVCMFSAIFMFRALPGQQALVVVSALFVGACVGVVIYVLTAGLYDTNPEVATRTAWGGGGLLLIATWIALWAAYRGISHDRKLLRSYDRLR